MGTLSDRDYSSSLLGSGLVWMAPNKAPRLAATCGAILRDSDCSRVLVRNGLLADGRRQ